jgi:flagella basal body P-ring formation protein FlgA
VKILGFLVACLLGLSVVVSADPPQPVIVQSSCSHAALNQAVELALQPFTQPGDVIDITVLNPALVNRLAGSWQFNATLQQMWSPRFVMLGQQGNRHIGIPVKVSILRKVWVAKGPIAQGQALSDQLVSIQAVPLQSGAQWLPATDNPVGLIARLPVSAGQPVDKKKVRLSNDVTAKQPVTVDVFSDDVMISMQAVADISGVRGQTIPVTAGKKHYQAEITGPNRARVNL